MIEVAPAESVSLIMEHLREHAEQIARHRHGCRIICRLLQRSYKRKQENPSLSELAGLEELLREVLNKAQALCCHIFAHHVIQYVLENTNNPEHKNKIFEALNGELQRCAQDRHASSVIQAALKCCRPCDVNSLADGLIDVVPSLATTRCGSYVYNTLCVHEDPDIKARAIGHQGEGHRRAQAGQGPAAGQHSRDETGEAGP
ncbi:unnamed protein product [Prorocentrum cordatum]|uniref:PUM-HD domain-containing protein n=1 Tax=Prorocentrum cordatum TaxID=2364126 RepID=A0ABN9S0R4_9DINO|nr:unnamed protein product [Polarella glacialis]